MRLFAPSLMCSVGFDEEKNCLFKYDGQAVAGFDPLRWNNLLLRALMKPAPDEKNNIVLFIALGSCILTLIFGVIILIKIGQLNSSLAVLRTVGSATVTGGNVP